MRMVFDVVWIEIEAPSDGNGNEGGKGRVKSKVEEDGSKSQCLGGFPIRCLVGPLEAIMSRIGLAWARSDNDNPVFAAPTSAVSIFNDDILLGGPVMRDLEG